MNRLLILFLILFPKLNSLAQSITAGTVSANDVFFPLAVDYTVRSSFNQSSTTIPGITYSVDINNDNELDFVISGGAVQIGQGGYFANLGISPLPGTLTSKQVAASTNSCTIINGPNVQTVTANMAKKFNSTDMIDNLTNWNNSDADLYHFERWGFNGCGMQNFYTPPAYIGVRLICQNDTIYGWIKVKNLNLSNTPFIELQVESYAINKSNCVNSSSCIAAFSPSASCAAGNMQFSNTSSGITASTNYTWTFGDGGKAYTQNTSHTYSWDGMFNVCLTIQDSSCLSAKCQTVNINCVFSSVSENAGNSSLIKVYPNPNNGYFNLVIDQIQMESKNIELLIYNVLGKEVYRSKEEVISGSLNKPIDLTNIVNGIYFVRLSTGTTNYTKKIIINK